MSDVIAEVHGPIVLLRLNRPERNNAIGGTLLRDLLEAVTDAARDDRIKVVVTTGMGSSFCVGGDIAEMVSTEGPSAHLLNSPALGGEKGLAPLSPQGELLDDLAIGRWVLRFRELEKPTIAALNGAAAGGGLALALLHDFRWAAESVRLTTGFARVGLTGELGITHLLPRLVGWQRAADLLLTARQVRADEAERMGLIDRVLPDAELLEATIDYATQLARLPSAAQQLTKRLLRSAAETTFVEQLRREYQAQLALFGLPETRAALAAVREQVMGEAG